MKTMKRRGERSFSNRGSMVKFSTPFVFLLLSALALSGCDQSPVPTVGFDLGSIFPERGDWFWKYNNDDRSEVAYFHNRGLTSPSGEEWVTYRLWVASEQSIIDDIADGEVTDWDVEIYWEETPQGWYLRGWMANPEGPSDHLGTTYFDEGVPFALSNVPQVGTSWEATANDEVWTTTVSREPEELEFNGQVIRDAWRLEIRSATGGSVLDSTWWLVNGPGFVQFDLPDFRAEGGESSWQHVHNKTFDDVLGAR